jgi:hypothetical protein
LSTIHRWLKVAPRGRKFLDFVDYRFFETCCAKK